MFSQNQVAEFKEAFQLMDHDKDGIISKSDLRATFDAVGKLSNEKELDEMINEAPGPINFTQLLGLFGTRMADSGGTDDDDVVVAAFKSFDENGTIDSERSVFDELSQYSIRCLEFFVQCHYFEISHLARYSVFLPRRKHL